MNSKVMTGLLTQPKGPAINMNMSYNYAADKHTLHILKLFNNHGLSFTHVTVFGKLLL